MRNIVTVVQARRDSSRLPGKILLPLAGEPLLLRMIERLQRARLAGSIVVATTVNSSDDALDELCRANAIPCFRGHPTDLLDRHFQCAKQYGADVVLKIPSDCPLIDPAVVDRVIDRYLVGDADYVSNLHPATYPDGQDVEVMAVPALERAWREATQDFEREHTTPYIWERPQLFRLANVEWETGLNYSMTHRLTIDYAEDYRFLELVFAALYPRKPDFGLADIVELLQRKPGLLQVNAKYAGVNWYRHHLDQLRTIRPDETKII